MRSVQTVKSLAYLSEVTFTRPSNATAYGALDVIGVRDVSVAANPGSAIHTFTNIGPAGGYIMITAADLRIDVATTPASSFILELYDASPTAILDAATYDLVAGDRIAHVLSIPIAAATDKGATCNARASQINEQIKLAEGSTTLYGLLVTVSGYTPTSAAVKRIRLHSVAL